METINEQIYEYLLHEDKPVTVPEVSTNEKFKGVPAGVVGKGLLSICGEGLANYYMEDGKIFFSTDLSVGRGTIGSQCFTSNLTSIFSTLFGGETSSAPEAETVAFPKVGDSATDAALEAIEFSTILKGKDFEIAFPQSKTIKTVSDSEHEFVVSYKDLPVALMTTNANTIDGDISEKFGRALLSKLYMHSLEKQYMCLSFPEKYNGDHAFAYYLPAAPASFAFVARPDGVHFLRIEWKFDKGLPSKRIVCKLFERWLSTYRYFGRKQYVNILPFDREELLKEKATPEIEQQIIDGFGNNLIELNRLIEMIKSSVDFDEAADRPTIRLYRVRKLLQEAAEQTDAIITQATNVITHYKTAKASNAFLNQLYHLSIATLNTAPTIAATVKAKVSNTPYYSATDIAFANTSTQEYLVHGFPKQYLDSLEMITTQIMTTHVFDAEEQEGAKAYYKNAKAAYEFVKKPPVYYPDYIFEGNMIAAYLGHDEEIVIPDFVTSIGAYAFQKAKELKKVTLGENVTAILFCPFEECSALRTLKVLGDILVIQGSFMSFGSSKLVVQGYANSNIEKHCKQNHISFEPIREDSLDCVIQLEKSKYDVYQGFALPRIVGYKTMQDLTASDRKKVASDENTSHLQYGMVPADKEFADYKDVIFSFTVIGDPVDLDEGGIQIAKEIESNYSLPTLHGVYRTVKADNGKVLVRYDTTKESNDNGVHWATYVVVIAREKKLVIAQVFFNGDFSQRQQQYALDKWASQILTGNSYKEKQRNPLESQSKPGSKQSVPTAKCANRETAHPKDQHSRNAAAKAKEELDFLMQVSMKKATKEAVEKTDAQNNAAIKADFERQRKALLSKQASLSAELSQQGLFAFGAKKELRNQITALTAQMEKLSLILQTIFSGGTSDSTYICCLMCRHPNQWMTISEIVEGDKRLKGSHTSAYVRSQTEKGLFLRTDIDGHAKFQLALYPAAVEYVAVPSEAELKAACLSAIVEKECIAVQGEPSYDSVLHTIQQQILDNQWKERKTPDTIVANQEVEELMDRILCAVSGTSLTISEIQESDPILQFLPRTRIATLARGLIAEGKLEKTEMQQKAYFSAI